MPLSEVTNDPRASGGLLFAGEEDWLRFVSPLPEHLGGGPWLMELGLSEPAQVGARGDLVLRWQPLDLTGDADATSPMVERVLIEAVERLEIAYFGSSVADQEPGWWRQWRHQRSLPTLIRLRVGFPDGDDRSWPELFVALMVDLAPPS